MLNSNIEFLLNDDLVAVDNLETNITILNYIRNEKNLKNKHKQL